jgi:hypothetical protein
MTCNHIVEEVKYISMVLKSYNALIFYADTFVTGDLACLLKQYHGYASFIYKYFKASHIPGKVV